MSINLSLPFSQSTGGRAVVVTPAAYPGVLIHESINERDFVWLWLSLPSYVPYTDWVNVVIVKGNSTSGYTKDSSIYVPSGVKTLVESGTLLTTNTNIYAYVDTSSSSITNVPASASGYVHRRIE
jgi:hypothetical protein